MNWVELPGRPAPVDTILMHGPRDRWGVMRRMQVVLIQRRFWFWQAFLYYTHLQFTPFVFFVASSRCEAKERSLVAAISRLCHRINGTNLTVFRVPSLLSAACSTAALQLPPHLARHQSKEFVWLSLQSENLLVIKRYLAWSDDEVFAHLLTPHHMCCCNIKYRTEVRVNHQNKTPLKRYLMINVCYFLICLLLSVSTSGLAAPESRLQLKCVVSMMLGLSGLWLWWYTGPCTLSHTSHSKAGAGGQWWGRNEAWLYYRGHAYQFLLQPAGCVSMRPPAASSRPARNMKAYNKPDIFITSWDVIQANRRRPS